MIETILIVYGAINVLSWLAKPSVHEYYRERYGKSWQQAWNDNQAAMSPEDYGFTFLIIPIVPIIFGWLYVWDNWVPKINNVIGHPGRLIAHRLNGTKKIVSLPSHTNDEFLAAAEKEVEEFLKKP